MNKALEVTLIKIYTTIFPLRFMRPHLFMVNRFVANVAKKYDKKNKKILDIGAEASPYRKLFKKSEYFSHDVKKNRAKTIDYVGDLDQRVPSIKSKSFDYILCTQVLEHLKRPHIAFKEFSRMLKPKGYLFLTTHMVFDEHMVPKDYFRFTKHGLRSLGEEAGFRLTHIRPHGGVFLVLGNILNELLIKLFFKRGTFLYYVYFVIFTIPIFVLNVLLYLLDFLDSEKSLTINYECIYKKT